MRRNVLAESWCVNGFIYVQWLHMLKMSNLSSSSKSALTVLHSILMSYRLFIITVTFGFIVTGSCDGAGSIRAIMASDQCTDLSLQAARNRDWPQLLAPNRFNSIYCICDMPWGSPNVRPYLGAGRNETHLR